MATHRSNVDLVDLSFSSGFSLGLEHAFEIGKPFQRFPISSGANGAAFDKPLKRFSEMRLPNNPRLKPGENEKGPRTPRLEPGENKKGTTPPG